MADMSGEVPIRISDFYPEASAIIRKYESVNQSGKPHLTPYYDKLGNKWTVGFGRTLGDKQTEGLTDDQIKERYAMPMEEAEADIDRQIETSLQGVNQLSSMLPEGVEFSKGEIEALIPLIQNVGITKIKSQGVKAMEALRKGNKKEFKKQLYDPDEGFVKAGGEKQKGLQARRLEEGSIAKIYEGGEFARKHGGMVMRNYYDYEPRSI